MADPTDDDATDPDVLRVALLELAATGMDPHRAMELLAPDDEPPAEPAEPADSTT